MSARYTHVTPADRIVRAPIDPRSARGNPRRLGRAGFGLLIVALALVISPRPAGAVGYPFYDAFESGMGNWAAGGAWGLTTSRSVSPTHCLTDTPGAYYGNNSDTAAALAGALNLAAAARPVLSFKHQYALEADYDYALVEVSTDGGSTWRATPLATYTGTVNVMTREQLDLSAWAGSADVRFRFRLVTDSSVVMDGWYLDDVRVGEAPSASVLALATNPTPTSVSLTWTASTATNFAAYRVCRSLRAGEDWRTVPVVAEYTSRTNTTWRDVAVSPKSHYYYRVMTLTSEELHALSPELAVTTPSGMDYPFLDNGEGGTGTWVAEAPWGLATNVAVSGTRSWTDSPGTNYANGIAAQSLTLVAPMCFSNRAVSPVLCFNHRYTFASGDSGNVEISTNSGAGWTSLASFAGNSSNLWLRGRFSLAAYTNAASVLLRFRLTTDASANADGWYLDDIAVAETPPIVPAPVLDQVASHSLRVTWQPVTNEFFARYQVFRSTTSPVGINSTLVADLPNAAVTSVVDTNLALDTVYYYRVYAANSHGVLSLDSPQESSARTLNNPAPFADDFEGSLINWNLTGTWGSTTNDAVSGTRCLTDSPGTWYTNSVDGYALTAVNLVGTTNPVLRFWDRYRVGSGDWGRVEVSTDGSSWSYRYGIYTTIRTNWAEQQIDLTEYRDAANLRIRFHFWSDSSGTEDGWYIDKVSVADNRLRLQPFPFFEGFENGLTNWLHADWALDTNQPYAGNYTVVDTPNLPMPPDGDLRLALDGVIDLTNTVNPQLTYWVRGSMGYRSNYRSYISTDGGYSYSELDGMNSDWSAGWTRHQVALSGYVNRKIRLMFRDWSIYGSTPWNDIVLDKISVQELPAPVVITDALPSLKTVTLNWTASSLGGAFQRNELYRSTGSGVSMSSTLLGVFTNAAVTSFTDSNLTIGTTYYYRIYTCDTNDTYVASNERSTTTVPLPYPLVDELETLDKWYVVGNWGVVTNNPFSGAFCINESPAGDYTNSANPYLMTAVNLAGATNPVLRFWDRYRMGSGDWGRVEVSTDGSGWSYRYGIYTSVRTNWAEQQIDLTEYRGNANLRIRFNFWSDSSGTEDGWFIDKVSVAENPLRVLAFPFYEGFENGLTNWLHANWAVDTNQPYAGNYAVVDTPSLPMPPDGDLRLLLDGVINLTNTVNPQLTYWVRGSLGYRSNYRSYISTDGGYSYSELDGMNSDWSAGWTRHQVSLSGYVNRKIRLMFRDWSIYGSTPWNDIVLDKISVQELPAPVVITDALPGLKTVTLNWTASSLGGAFQRNELYRSTSSGVGMSSTLLGVFTNAAVTSFTDSNLTIGTTYYYRMYTCDTNDAYVASNERSTTTVPLPYPLVDDLETLDKWYVVGGWGVVSNNPLSGLACVNESPAGDYANSASAYILTAVNLSGATNPVLRFSDRYRMGSGDWGRVEVSTDGSGWSYRYGIYTSVRTNWAEQQIDLTEYRGNANLRIRFNFWSDSSGTEDGWFIDKMSVAENPLRVLPFPFYEGFENGLTNWLHANWALDTNQPYAGNYVVVDTPNLPMPPDGDLRMVLDGAIDLTNTVNPQLVYWVRGNLAYRSNYRSYISTDGGYSYSELDGMNSDWSAGWTRHQVSLSGYVNKKIRLMFRDWSIYGSTPWNDVVLDKISVQEMPPAVVLAAVPGLKSAEIGWTPSTLGNAFQRYELYRATSAGVSLSSTLVGVYTNAAVTNFTDPYLVIGSTYYYRIYTVDTNDCYVGSNERAITTIPLTFPVADSMDSLASWYATGTWGVTTQNPFSGTGCATESPAGDYANSSDSYLMTSVNLVGTTNPVLRFWDRYRSGGGDWGRVEISTDGSGWSYRYAIYSSRTNWAEQSIDLTPFRGNSNVRIRFHFWSDSSGTDDGWGIDSVSIAETCPLREIAYPFYETFENGLTNWLHASWALETNAPFAGGYAVNDSVGQPMGLDCDFRLVLNGEINLTNAVNPQLTYWLRGSLSYRTQYRAYVSADGGVNWTAVDSLDNDWSSTGWVKRQASLAGYVNKKIRLLFLTASLYSTSPWNDVVIDNISVGGSIPSAPTAYAPANLAIVDVLRPTLVVRNAVSYGGNPLTYRFEVYGDAALSSLVAQVPIVAAGADYTSWQLDVSLTNALQYWWRCRAAENSTNLGPWTLTSSFFVNETNHPPVPVQLVGPPQWLLANTNGVLSWYATTDPDPGDTIRAYHLQVDDDLTFATPVIDDPNLLVNGLPPSADWTISVPLSRFAGSANLAAGRLYYWRVRAQDSRWAYSAWPADGPQSFTFAPPPLITRLSPTSTNYLVLDWVGGSGSVYLEYAPALGSTNWRVLGGPVSATRLVFPMPTNSAAFFRLRQ